MKIIRLLMTVVSLIPLANLNAQTLDQSAVQDKTRVVQEPARLHKSVEVSSLSKDARVTELLSKLETGRVSVLKPYQPKLTSAEMIQVESFLNVDCNKITNAAGTDSGTILSADTDETYSNKTYCKIRNLAAAHVLTDMPQRFPTNCLKVAAGVCKSWLDGFEVFHNYDDARKLRNQHSNQSVSKSKNPGVQDVNKNAKPFEKERDFLPYSESKIGNINSAEKAQ